MPAVIFIVFEFAFPTRRQTSRHHAALLQRRRTLACLFSSSFVAAPRPTPARLHQRSIVAIVGGRERRGPHQRIRVDNTCACVAVVNHKKSTTNGHAASSTRADMA